MYIIIIQFIFILFSVFCINYDMCNSGYLQEMGLYIKTIFSCYLVMY